MNKSRFKREIEAGYAQNQWWGGRRGERNTGSGALPFADR